MGAGTSRRGAGNSRRGAGISRRGAGTSRRGAGISRRRAGTSRRGAGTSRRRAGTSRRGAGISRRGAGISRRRAGISRRRARTSRRRAGISRRGAGISRRGAGISRRRAGILLVFRTLALPNRDSGRINGVDVGGCRSPSDGVSRLGCRRTIPTSAPPTVSQGQPAQRRVASNSERSGVARASKRRPLDAELSHPCSKRMRIDPQEQRCTRGAFNAAAA